MSNLPVPMPLSEADYDMIESAVLETTRGRWFLAEYARRNRHADTTMLLGAIERLEASLRGEATPRLVDRLRFDLVEMANSIVRTKAEIATIKPGADQHGKFGEATEELDSIVQATETATSEILAAAEQVQEIAWTLREQGLDPMVCDTLDTRATEIYTACSFQDLTGQRTSKVIEVMRYLEGRINAMIDIWGLRGTMSAEAEVAAEASQAHVLSGPARPGYGLDQSGVDVVMGPPMGALGARSESADRSGGDRPERERRRLPSGDRAAASEHPAEPSCEAPSVQHQLDPAAPDSGTNSRAHGLTAGLSHETSQALARIEALTVEEKLALFS
jgi:chemotaxis protein CheZ